MLLLFTTTMASMLTHVGIVVLSFVIAFSGQFVDPSCPSATVPMRISLAASALERRLIALTPLVRAKKARWPVPPGALCRKVPLRAVHQPFRLVVEDPCMYVTGTVAEIARAKDGDEHVRVALDAKYRPLLDRRNMAVEHGDLVVEIIPADQANVRMPPVGTHVELGGSYVLDASHGWMEIHPVWYIRNLSTGRVQRAPLPTGNEACRPDSVPQD